MTITRFEIDCASGLGYTLIMSNAPKPLTATPSPNLNWSSDGAPISDQYDDIYFSVDGGLAETRAVFLQGCGLPGAWEDVDIFTIGELGSGSGLNFLAAWELWQRTAKPEQILHFVSIEAFPWSSDDLRKGLAHWPELEPLAERLIEQWPGQVKGVHRIHFGNVSLTLFHMPVREALSSMNAKIDAWFLDGFSPAKNPDMWSDDVFKSLAELSNSGATLATFTVAGHVRRGLSEVGFTVNKKPGFGRKRERLEAVLDGLSHKAFTHSQTHSPVIIGGGIAGASIAKAYHRRGVSPCLIDPEPDLRSAASGNPRALVMPRLDVQDRPESRFFLAAYLYALGQYQAEGSVCETGVFQMAKSQAEALRFEKLIRYAPLPTRHMTLMGQEQARNLCGLEIVCELGGLYFKHAQTIDPKKTIRQWTQNCQRIKDCAVRVSKQDDLWVVYNDSGEILAKTDTLFITAGANILDLAALDVRFTLGQICWGESEIRPNTALIYGGYCLPYKGGVLLGASHDHVGAGQNNRVSDKDSREVMDEYSKIVHDELLTSSFQSRASVRVTTKNTLPIAASYKDGCYVLSGLGSRGFMMAPLLGEALVCAARGEPSPLCLKTSVRFGAREKS